MPTCKYRYHVQFAFVQADMIEKEFAVFPDQNSESEILSLALNSLEYHDLRELDTVRIQHLSSDRVPNPPAWLLEFPNGKYSFNL
jgi:hypothetical protein